MLQLPTSPSASSGKTKTRYPYSRRLPLPSTLRGHCTDACGQTYSSHLINWQTILWLHIIHCAGLISYKLAINSATVSFTSLDYVWVEPCFVITVSNILTGAWATRFISFGAETHIICACTNNTMAFYAAYTQCHWLSQNGIFCQSGR